MAEGADQGRPSRTGLPSGWVCVLTAQGRGAVACLRWEGDLCVLRQPTPLVTIPGGPPVEDLELNRIRLAHWGTDVREDVVLCRTARNVMEFHCHGGRAAVERIVQDLVARGGAVESPEGLLRRTEAFLEVECQLALQRAATERAAGILAVQAAGRLRGELEAIRRLPSTSDQVKRLDRLLAWRTFAVHLTRPWSVALCGRPNVGKSSLLNALTGYSRAIVSPQPGTTRDVVTAEVVFEGWLIELSDTAGVRTGGDGIERAGIERGRARLAAADLRLLLLDVNDSPGPEEEQLSREFPDAIVVAHKCDLPSRWPPHWCAEALRVSSQAGTGLEELSRRIVARLIPRLPGEEAAIPVSEGVVRELVRLKEALNASRQSLANAVWDSLLLLPQASRGLAESSLAE